MIINNTDLVSPSLKNSVAKTLLIPLWVRYMDSISQKPLINDKVSKMITELYPDILDEFVKFNSISPFIKNLTYKGIIFREEIFDEIVSKEIEKNDDLIIVNLACGFDARHLRISGYKKWIDLDLPEVIDLKRKLFYEGDDYQMIEESLFNFKDLNYVDKHDKILFICEGTLMYFEKNRVQSFLNELKSEYVNSSFAFEFLGRFGKNKVHPFVKKLDLNTPYKSSFTNKDLNKLFVIENEFSFLDRHKDQWGFIGKLLRLFPKLKKDISSTVYLLKNHEN